MKKLSILALISLSLVSNAYSIEHADRDPGSVKSQGKGGLAADCIPAPIDDSQRSLKEVTPSEKESSKPKSSSASRE